MNFSYLDVAIIIAYLVGIAVFGIFTGGKQRSARDYFLSDSSIPWWAVCFAIVATETSALTFISVPGIAYLTNLNFLQLALGYLIGRVIVAQLFIPAYFKGELPTAYAFLETKFGSSVRKTISITFMGTRVAADGVRLYTTAIPLALLLKGFGALPAFSPEVFYMISIVVMAIITLIYVFLGGVRAVIWTDVIQMFIYIIGALLSGYVLLDILPLHFDEVTSILTSQNKITFINFGFENGWMQFFSKPYTLIASIIGGMFLSMASHGTDQIIVQRILTTRSVGDAKKAMIGSGIIVFLQFALFLFVGSLLFLYYGGDAYSANEVFPKFIVEKIPSGISGLIIAGLLAAAMSTLSGSISALSSTTMMDIILPLSARKWDDAGMLRTSRWISILWCALLIIVAMFFIRTPKAVVEIALSIASFTYGGMLGVFLLALLKKKILPSAALIGFFSSLIAMTIIILTTSIAWTWYTVIGATLAVGVGYIAQQFLSRSSEATSHGAA